MPDISTVPVDLNMPELVGGPPGAGKRVRIELLQDTPPVILYLPVDWASGEKFPVIIAHPFRLDVTDFLLDGANTIEIEVTNLSANRIRDLDQRKVGWKKFNDINIVDHHYKKFDASEWPVELSGLLGPVALLPMTLAVDMETKIN